MQTQDYYTYTAVKYAKDAGHEAIVELLGGEEDGEAWVEVEELYTGTDTGEDGEESGPTGGLWIRHMDPQTGLAYYMNDETGEGRIGTYLESRTETTQFHPSGLPPRVAVDEWRMHEFLSDHTPEECIW